MADNLMRYSLEVGWGGGQQGTKMHPRDEGEWVKYADVVMSKDFDAMKARAETAEARLTAAREVLKAVEWRIAVQTRAAFCPLCLNIEEAGHAPGCGLDAVLNPKEEVKC